jgi:hypothetical protein
MITHLYTGCNETEQVCYEPHAKHWPRHSPVIIMFLMCCSYYCRTWFICRHWNFHGFRAWATIQYQLFAVKPRIICSTCGFCGTQFLFAITIVAVLALIHNRLFRGLSFSWLTDGTKDKTKQKNPQMSAKNKCFTVFAIDHDCEHTEHFTQSKSFTFHSIWWLITWMIKKCVWVCSSESRAKINPTEGPIWP